MATKITVNGRYVEAAPTDVGQKVQLDPELKSALTGFLSENLQNPEYLKFVGAARGGDGASLMDDAPVLTRSQQRLARLEAAAATETVRRVDVPGDNEPYWVKRGGFADLTHAAALSGRDETGVLSLSAIDNLTGFIAALLFVFTVNSESDKSRYFESRDDARAFANAPNSGDAAGMLFYAIVALNNEVWPEGAKQAGEVWAALKAAQTASLAPLSKKRKGA